MRISPHEVAVFKALSFDRWLTCEQVAAQVKISQRTARKHLPTLCAAMLAERIEAFPKYLYRRLPVAPAKATPYTKMLIQLAGIF